MLFAEPDTSLNCFFSCLFISGITLNSVVSYDMSWLIFAILCVKLLIVMVIVFSFNSDIVRNWDCSIKWIPFLRGAMTTLLVFWNHRTIRPWLWATFSGFRTCKSGTYIKSVVNLILLKGFILLKCLNFLNIYFIFGHGKLGLKNMLFSFKSLN